MINLKRIISDEIEHSGAMPLDRFIKLALGHQQQGYYSNLKNIGKNGDFITSPEISQLFGEIMGIWCANFWLQLGSPAQINLAELGPGNGTLAHDILRTTKNIPGFHQALSLHFVELDNKLRQKQQAAVSTFLNIKKYWHDDVAHLPKKATIFIANEFFDALPICQYIKRKDNWYTICVDIDQALQELVFSEMPLDDRTLQILTTEYAHVPHNGIIETCSTAESIIKQIATHIQKYNGGGLFIDYGYIEQPNRLFISSLQAVKDHKYSPVLTNIGSADLSAHVNFTALKDAAQTRGVKVHGPISQREFLLNMHIEARKDRLLKSASPAQHSMILSGYNRLINQMQMGLLFKAIALTRQGFSDYIGFK